MSRVRPLGAIIVSLAFLSAILSYGCSDSSPRITEEQLAYLQKARTNMLEVASFGFYGDAIVDMDAFSESGSIKVRVEGVYEKVGEGSLVEMHISVEGHTSGEGGIELAATGYLEGDTVYMTMDGTKWYRTDLTPVPSGALQAANLNIAQFLPEQTMMMIDFAEGIQVIAEDEDSIEFELIMGKDFYILQKKSEAEQNAGKKYEDLSPQEKQEVEMSVDMNMRYGKTSYFYTIDKETGLLIAFGNTFSMNIRSSSEKISMSGEMWDTFSDYGKDFSIQVPEEARDAEYLPPGTSIDL